MKKQQNVPKRRNGFAAALSSPIFRGRALKSGKAYSRKGANSSTRKFEDSIQHINGGVLIEIYRGRLKCRPLGEFFF